MSDDYLMEINRAKTPMANTVIIDLDGVITDFINCPHRGDCDYRGYPETINLDRSKCPVNKEARHNLKYLKSLGMNIIIQTSRVDRERVSTFRWLKANDIPFDQILFNKPRGFIYCDDLGYRFKDWKSFVKEVDRRRNITSKKKK